MSRSRYRIPLYDGPEGYTNDGISMDNVACVGRDDLPSNPGMELARCGRQIRKEPINAVHYDYNPTVRDSRMILWIGLKSPAPSWMRIGMQVRLVSADRNLTIPAGTLRILDIVGTRIVLEDPIMGGPPAWAVGRARGGPWGTATLDWKHANKPMRSWDYGMSFPIAYVVAA